MIRKGVIGRRRGIGTLFRAKPSPDMLIDGRPESSFDVGLSPHG